MMLVVEDLESGYGSMQVLWRPSFHVMKGSITSLFGPNGVGKSTLLYTVFGSIVPYGGTITYEGEDVTDLPTASLSQYDGVRQSCNGGIR